MNDYEMKVKDVVTVGAVSKAIINETSKWGFKQSDYISLVNDLLDLSLIKPSNNEPKVETKAKLKRVRLNLPLSGNNIQIKLFDKEKDYQTVVNWLKDDFSRWFLLSRSYSRDKTFLEMIEDDENVFGIILLEGSTPIGIMGYLSYDQVNQKAEIRKLIGEQKHRGKGYAKEATALWIQYGINNLNLNKIYLNTIENNIRNVGLNKELGFQIEGVLRKEIFIDNKYYDVLRMAYIVED